MLQAAHQSSAHANEHADEHANNEADVFCGYLRKGGAVSKNQDSDCQELLHGLHNVDEVTSLWTEAAEKWVAETHHGVSRRVESDERPPDAPSADPCEDTEDDVQGNTSTIPDTGEDISTDKSR